MDCIQNEIDIIASQKNQFHFGVGPTIIDSNISLFLVLQLLVFAIINDLPYDIRFYMSFLIWFA
jgi:hypothetical protein